MQRTGALHDHRPFAERADDRPETRALIRRAGAAGTVLLKNDGLLPLAAPQRQDRGDRPERQGGADHGRRIGAAEPALRRSAPGTGWPRVSARTGCCSRRAAPTTDGSRCLTGESDRRVLRRSRFLRRPRPCRDHGRGTRRSGFRRFAGGKVDPARRSARASRAGSPRRESGIHRFGLAAAGYARLFVDGRLVADAWDGWTKGRTFFEEGCDEVVGEVVLQAGRSWRGGDRIRRRSEPTTCASRPCASGSAGRMGDAEIAAAAAVAASAETALVFVGRSGEWDTEGSDLDGDRAARPPGRTGRGGAEGQPAHGGRAADRRAGGTALDGRGPGDPAGLVSRPGMRQCHRRCAVRRCRARRPPAADLPGALAGQPDLEPGPGGLSRARRQGALRGRRVHRLPPLRPARHRADVRLRSRPGLYRLRPRRACGRLRRVRAPAPR